MPTEVHRSEKFKYFLVVRQIVKPDFVTYVVCQLRAASSHLTSLQTVSAETRKVINESFPTPTKAV